MGEALPDGPLMARCADGDAQVFEELFRRYEPRASTYFLRRTGSPERAEDLFQGLSLRIHQARTSYDPAHTFVLWFFQFARRLLVDDVRRAFRAREVPLHDRDPEERAQGSDDRLATRERVDRLLELLSPVERYVLATTKVGGVGYPDLTEDPGRPAAAIRKLASRAIQRLRADGNLRSPAIHAS